MNAYEQLRNAFLTEIVGEIPSVDAGVLEKLGVALDRAAYRFEVQRKETTLTIYEDPVPELVKIYIVVKKTEGRADGTLENYTRVLCSFFRWFRKQTADVASNDIRMYLYEYSRSRKVSDRTLDKYREVICWFFKWAYDEEYIPRNPARAIKAIKFETKERQALSQMELEYLRMACRTVRDKALIEVFYSTGCRVTELTRLKRADVDWQAGTVHLFGKGKKHRTSYLNAKAVVALKHYLDRRNDDSEMLFVTERAPHRPLSKESVELAIRAVSARAGLGRRITPHVLRHTTATQAVNSGMPIEDVSKLLGHASVATTMIYAKTSHAKVQSEHLRCVV